MATYRQVNLRSPFFSQYSTLETSAFLDLRIWTGDVVSDRPTDATYEMTKEAVDGAVTFEVAELIRDYLSQTSTLSSGTVWFEITMGDDGAGVDDVETYLGTEGYTTYIEGLQHNGNSWDADFVGLPVDSDGSYRVQVTESYAGVIPVYVQSQVAGDWSYEKFNLSNVGQGSVDFTLLPNDHNTMVTYITVTHNDSKVVMDFNGTAVTVYVDALECSKYNSTTNKPVILQYVNKYGMKTRLPFSMKYVGQIKTSSDSFTRNLTNYGNLATNNNLHAERKRITNSKQSFTINTDFMSEYYVQQVEELLLSEYVWALVPTVNDSLYQSVNVATSDMVTKTHLNDKLIQYTFEIETAANYINQVR